MGSLLIWVPRYNKSNWNLNQTLKFLRHRTKWIFDVLDEKSVKNQFIYFGFNTECWHKCALKGRWGQGPNLQSTQNCILFFRISYICMRRCTFFSRCYCGHWLVEAHHRWLIVAPLIPEGENAQLQCSVFVLVSASVFLGEDLEYFAFVLAIASVF